MKKKTISFIIEIIGAVGVIASLIYLSVQIKQSNKVAKAEITKDLYLASRQAILDIASDDNLGRIWAEMRNFENEDLARKYAFYQSFFRLYELQHMLDEENFFVENIAISYSLVIQMFAKTNGFLEYWKIAKNEFNKDFVKHVDEQIELAFSK